MEKEEQIAMIALEKVDFMKVAAMAPAYMTNKKWNEYLNLNKRFIQED